jgi:hypothetical protein
MLSQRNLNNLPNNNSFNSFDSLSYSVDSNSYSVDSRSYSIDSRSYSIDSTFSYEFRPQSGEQRSRAISIGLTISPGNSYEEKSFIKKQVENEKRKTQNLLEETSQKLEQDLKLKSFENNEKKRRKKDLNLIPPQKEPKTVEQLKKSMKKII